MTPRSQARASAQELIARRLGLSFPESRHEELERKLRRAAQRAGAADVGGYVSVLERLPSSSAEWRLLASDLTVGETYFMRDRRCFEALEQEVLGPLIARRRSEGARRLRIWSAGCASGEEPYSLALLVDRLLPDRADWSLTILATDLNPQALSTARQGRYREWSLRELPEPLRDRHFRRRPGRTFELDPAIRRMVTFAPLNLAEDTYPSSVTNTSAMDLILCRNVLMYLTREAQRKAAARLRRALVDGGWLVVSPAEASAELLPALEPINAAGAILHRKHAEPNAATPRLPRPAPRQLRSAAPAPDDPPEKPALLELANAEAGRGNLDHARDLCREAVARDRLDTEAYVLLAAIEQERGEPAAAVDALRRAIYVAPDWAAAHFILGSLLLGQGQTSKGRQSMATVVALLDAVPSDQVVPGADGLPAGRLRETARAHLEAA